MENKLKFNIGNYIANDYCSGKVIELTDDAYLLDTGQGIPFSCEHNAHIWSIADAKDGDVLANEQGTIIVFQSMCSVGHANAHCCIENGNFIARNIGVFETENFHPASEEQKELMLSKMKESGYELDEEKKEIKNVKMENENIEKFIVGKWYICINDFFGKVVHFDKGTAYFCSGEERLQAENGYHIAMPENSYSNFKLWSISDAKKGDVLVHNGCTFIFMGIKDGIVQAFEENMLEPISFGEPDKDDDYQPATKEQCELLCRKIAEAGYAWNPEKEGIEKIGGTPDENTIEPKFKAGDVIVHKLSLKMGSSSWVSGKIEKVEDDRYIFTDGSYTVIKDQDGWAFFDHMPTENTIQPKFKAGDRIVHSVWKDIYPYSSCGTIKEVKDDRYIFTDGSYIKMCDQDLWELSKDDDCDNSSTNNGLRYALSILEQSLGYVQGYQTKDGLLKHKQAITAVRSALKQKTAQPD